MKRTRVLFLILCFSVTIAIMAWSKEIFQFKQHNGTVLLSDVNQSADAKMEIPLHAAVKENNLVEVKRLVNEGADVNQKNSRGTNALFWAVVDKRNHEMAVFLIENGAEVNNFDLPISPLELAANNNDIELIKLLIDKGATVSGPDESPLLGPAGKGYIEAIDLLVANGADVNAGNDNGWSALTQAVYDRNIETMKTLIKYNVNINYKDDDFLTPLHHAVGLGFKEGVALLLDNGADTEAKTKNDSLRPLHMAVIEEHKEIVRMLLQHDAEINALNSRNQTALNIATYSQGILQQNSQVAIDTGEITAEEITEGLVLMHEITELLIVHGAQISLHDAVFLEDMDCVKELLEKGADINAKDCVQMTPLHHAIATNQLEMCEYLLREGADVNIKTQNGMTPLDMAIDNKHSELAKLLEDYSSNLK